jgi:hypothetical protein
MATGFGNAAILIICSRYTWEKGADPSAPPNMNTDIEKELVHARKALTAVLAENRYYKWKSNIVMSSKTDEARKKLDEILYMSVPNVNERHVSKMVDAIDNLIKSRIEEYHSVQTIPVPEGSGEERNETNTTGAE